jgi:hypothetical protein
LVSKYLREKHFGCHYNSHHYGINMANKTVKAAALTVDFTFSGQSSVASSMNFLTA